MNFPGTLRAREDEQRTARPVGGARKGSTRAALRGKLRSAKVGVSVAVCLVSAREAGVLASGHSRRLIKRVRDWPLAVEADVRGCPIRRCHYGGVRRIY